MLHTRRERPSREALSRSAARTRGGALTEFLLDVLESAESYDAHILQAEREEDPELAEFLRELRRQDLVRTREVTRLLRRPYEDAWGETGKEIGA